MAKVLDWTDWLYGLVGGFIGGGASGVIASLAAMGITPESYNLSLKLGSTLKLFLACFILNGAISMFLWLKQKPLPELIERETVTITKEIKHENTQVDSTTSNNDGKS